MPANMWLKLDGCEGEAQAGGHEKEIEVDNFRWGMNHPVSMTNSGPSAGVSSMDYIVIDKKIDKASPVLMKYCLKAIVKDALLCVRKDGGSAIDYLKIKMTNAVVSNVNPNQASNQPGMETVALAFEKVQVDYTPQAGGGAGEGAVSLKWDVKKWDEF